MQPNQGLVLALVGQSVGSALGVVALLGVAYCFRRQRDLLTDCHLHSS
ncbi:MAG: hypothetical protein GY792_36415 [Gammaproteobacteria bacterium]|nr:hypothetical protein [Gammaproteobacteria bacterium]